MLLDEASLALRLDRALADARFTVVSRATHTFNDPTAVTIARILAESHVVLHTWPEHGLVTMDLFSCAGKAKTDQLIERVVDYLAGVLASRTDERVLAPGSP